MTEILEELPKLTHQQRRELCQRIIALEAEQIDLASCDRAATEGFSQLDRMEAKGDGYHKKVREGFLQLAQEYENMLVVDAAAGIETVHKNILQLISEASFT